MTTADLHRAPLIDRIIDLEHGVSVHAEASLKEPGQSLSDVLTVSLSLELMAQTAVLVAPHHRLVRLRAGDFVTSLGAGSAPPVLTSARRLPGEHAEYEVTLSLPRTGKPPMRIASAVLEMADAPRTAPTLDVEADWSVDRRGRHLNGAALYAATELASQRPPQLSRVVQWASMRGLGQLIGAMGPRSSLFAGLSASMPLASSPGVIESVCRLVEWQWYALAGEGGIVHGVDRIEWYRIPRADESLLATISCRGSALGSPSFDATVLSTGRKPALQLHGVRLLPAALTSQRAAQPRVEWHAFMRLLDAQNFAAQ